MTVFAGIIELSGSSIEVEKELLYKAFEKHCNDRVCLEFETDSALLASFDIGAFSEKGFSKNGNSLTLVVGDPLLNGELSSRARDATLINNDWLNIKTPLCKSRGVFSGVSIDTNKQNMILFTDKLGIRPLYYYCKDNLLIYTSVLSVLEELQFIFLKPSSMGVCENLAFGYCLSDRTQYEYIKRLDCGELLITKGNSLSISKYWDWNKGEDNNTESVGDIYKVFEEAVKIRQGKNNNAIAFLSGGLDSRAIAAQVNLNVKNLYTFNFSTSRSQDSECAKLFAVEAKLLHSEKLFPTLVFPNWAQLISDEISNMKTKFDIDTNQKLVWSGDGGSVGIGYVYIDEKSIENIVKGDITESVRYFLLKNKITLPTVFFNKKHSHSINSVLVESVEKEISKYIETPTKAMYRFLMSNDQKRHLGRHFETICQHKVEFLLPFFDSNFLEKINAVPANELMYHKFYMRWFNFFPRVSRSVSWQTYPKHEACPIAPSENLTYQWSKDNKRNKVNYKVRFQDFCFYTSIMTKANITEYFSSYKLFIGMFLHLTGIKDYSYLIKKLKCLTNE